MDLLGGVVNVPMAVTREVAAPILDRPAALAEPEADCEDDDG